MLRLSSLALALLALVSSGCAGSPTASRWPLRALSSDAPQLEQPAFEAPAETSVPSAEAQSEAPRIGAPGGSGAGARRVATARD